VFPVSNDVVEWHFFNQLGLYFAGNFINDRADKEKVGVPDRVIFQAKLLYVLCSQENVEHNELDPDK
jgi:hypothetical protein